MRCCAKSLRYLSVYKTKVSICAMDFFLVGIRVTVFALLMGRVQSKHRASLSVFLTISDTVVILKLKRIARGHYMTHI